MQTVLNAILYVLIVVYAVTAIIKVRELAQLMRLGESGARVLKLAWVIMLVGTALWMTRDSAVVGASTLDTSAFLQIGSALTAAAICLIAFLRFGMVSATGALPAVLLMIYGFVGISTAGYSPAPLFSIYKAGLIIVDGLLVIALTSYLPKDTNGRSILEITYLVLTLYIFGAALGAVFWPDKAYQELGGVFGLIINGSFPYMNANELGFLSAVIAVVSIRRVFDRSRNNPQLYYLASFALSSVILIVSQARTALIGFIVVLFFYVFTISRVRSVLIPVLLVVVMAGIWIGSAEVSEIEDVAVDYARRGATDEQLESLSGRTSLWKWGWSMFSDSPILGHGFEAGVKYGGAAYGIPEGMHMHNAHMQVLVNSGILGYIFWIGMVLVVASRVFRLYRNKRLQVSERDREYYAELMAIVIIIMIKTLTGSMLVFHQNSLMLYMAIMIILARYRIDAASKVVIQGEDPEIVADKMGRGARRILRYKKGNTQ